MCEQTWLIERVLEPDERSFLHWVGERTSPLQARMVTEWPPGEEDLDYAQERVGDGRVVAESAEVAEILGGEGIAPVEVRPFEEAERTRVAAWRPFALVDRLIERSEVVTIHGARCETVVPTEAWARLSGPFPHLTLVDGLFPLLVVVQEEGERWRMVAGDVPRAGQSLRTWLAGTHPRFSFSRSAPHAQGDWALSGIRSVRAAEQVVVAWQALEASCDCPPDREMEVELDCATGTTLRLRVLPPAVASDRAALARLLPSSEASHSGGDLG